MTGSSELNIKTGDWAVLRNGTVIGPITPNDGDLYVWKIDDFTWTALGEFIEGPRGDHKRGFDIIDTLPCPPLERIRQLEEALRFYADKENYKERYIAEDCGCCSYWHHANIGKDGDEGETARRALGENK